jgi:hypothetical protein
MGCSSSSGLEPVVEFVSLNITERIPTMQAGSRRMGGMMRSIGTKRVQRMKMVIQYSTRYYGYESQTLCKMGS